MTDAQKVKTEDAVAVPHANIAAALAAAQSEMGKALKSANNPHFRSKYADLASVMDACMPSLSAHGIAVIQPTTDDDGDRYVETVLIHGETGETLKCRVPLIVSKNDMQGYGSAVTYARRYGLMSMAGIAPEDDDGNAAAKAPPQERREQQGPTKGQVNGAKQRLADAENLDDLKAAWSELSNALQHEKDVIAAKDARKASLEAGLITDDLDGDEIPY